MKRSMIFGQHSNRETIYDLKLQQQCRKSRSSPQPLSSQPHFKVTQMSDLARSYMPPSPPTSAGTKLPEVCKNVGQHKYAS
eukprot:scaffold42992_cov17-Tisochrysis_lutea.AAC.1